MQEDSSLGDPDWDEVITSTALDIGQLLPTKKELKEALQRMGCDVTECEDSWQETMEEVDKHVRTSSGLRRRRSVYAVGSKDGGGGTPRTPGSDARPDGGGGDHGERDRHPPMMRHSLSFNVLNRVRFRGFWVACECGALARLSKAGGGIVQ